MKMLVSSGIWAGEGGRGEEIVSREGLRNSMTLGVDAYDEFNEFTGRKPGRLAGS